jgi:hypothetical protein
MLVNNIGMLDIEDSITVGEWLIVYTRLYYCFKLLEYDKLHDLKQYIIKLIYLDWSQRFSNSALLMRLLFVWLQSQFNIFIYGSIPISLMEEMS